MKGAREYAGLFKTGQIGKMFFVSGSHARGKTFSIWILPTDEKIKVMPWTCTDAVEVYGVVSGQPGWTESYGWLHYGKWCEDFEFLVKKRKEQIEKEKLEHQVSLSEKEKLALARRSELLQAY